MQIGKLDSKLLTDIVFRHLTFRRPEVLTRPGIGEDCAVVDFGTYDCVLSTDPITAAASDIGRLAMHISCNDIASNGVEPLAIMLAILLPPETTEEEIEEIMRQAGEVSEALGVEIVGGHTEITSAVNKPVVVSTALGRALKGGLEAGRGTKPGDWILVTKQAGLEGTGIIAREREAELAALLSQQELAEAKAMLEQVSVVREGVIAGRIGVADMHDITEGGILGAVWEVCEKAFCGAEIFLDRIPVSPVTKKICAHYDMDWMRLISSGSMLIVVPEDKLQSLEQALKEAAIPVARIGQIQEADRGRVLISQDGREGQKIQPPGSDELYRLGQ